MTIEQTNTDPISFFEIAFQAYTQASQQTGEAFERDYQIGPYRIRLCFASMALAPLLMPALEHLAQEVNAAHPPDLTVYLWDSASTATAMPPCPWDWRERGVARVETQGVVVNERIQIAADAASGLLNMLDVQRNRAMVWIESADRIPYHEQGSPLRNILHWWLRAREMYILHAGAVATAQGGALLVGKGGSGKSTAALTCLNQGWNYLSDDYCLLNFTPEPRGYSLYNSAKLHGEHIQRFPNLLGFIHNPTRLQDEKALLFLQRHIPDQIVREAAVRAVLLPRITGLVETRLQPASAIAALQALAPSSIFQFPRAGSVEFQAISRLVQAVPCYWLDMGTELSAIPPAIASAIEGSVHS